MASTALPSFSGSFLLDKSATLGGGLTLALYDPPVLHTRQILMSILSIGVL